MKARPRGENSAARLRQVRNSLTTADLPKSWTSELFWALGDAAGTNVNGDVSSPRNERYAALLNSIRTKVPTLRACAALSGDLQVARVCANYSEQGLALEQNLRGYGFGLGVRVRKSTGASGWLGSPGDYGWAGANGTYFWVDPKEQLIGIVLMATRVGILRTEFPNAVYQAIVD